METQPALESEIKETIASRTYAIGDIHGCVDALDALLEYLPIRPEDTLVFLGDYVDRGPDSYRVLLRLIEMRDSRPNTVFLRGNHDIWMVRAQHEVSWFKSWLQQGVGGTATLKSYQGMEHVPAEHFAFLEIDCRDFYENEHEIFVHGAVEADLDLEFQTEDWLQWGRVYNQQPHFSGKRVICGHTSQKNGVPLDRDHAVCIDTYCFGGQWLTALCTETGEYFQANQKGETRRAFL
jgi:serine/threonine protein phosphatase 1